MITFTRCPTGHERRTGLTVHQWRGSRYLRSMTYCAGYRVSHNDKFLVVA